MLFLLLACSAVEPLTLVASGDRGVTVDNQYPEPIVTLAWTVDPDEDTTVARSDLVVNPGATLRLGIPDGANILIVESADGTEWAFVNDDYDVGYVTIQESP